ncbi:hypothetical protein CRG98_026526, partial [Punica granatum]
MKTTFLPFLPFFTGPDPTGPALCPDDFFSLFILLSLLDDGCVASPQRLYLVSVLGVCLYRSRRSLDCFRLPLPLHSRLLLTCRHCIFGSHEVKK